ISGLLVKRYPNLIAGYNSMSPERKQRVDIDGLSSWMRNGFVWIGALTIIGYYVLKYVGFDTLADNVMLITLLGGTLIIAIFTKRYDKGKRK
ncbi:MAG: DUF3784 domain-containing protein, partial [Bacteroidota bacterium]